ncbi:MAG: c-type cytochrome [Woeseiaceae bacterium]
MPGYSKTLIALFAVLCLSACDQVGQSENTIYLPEGDADSGKETFVALGCVSCHSVVGAELPDTAEAGSIRVLLGSQTSRRMTYGELVTAIVNPSHRLSTRYRKDEISQNGESLMTSYVDVMTVAQLTDLAAFLQQHYVKAERAGYKYPVYDYSAEVTPEDETEGSP